jgi:6-phosphofructokinase
VSMPGRLRLAVGQLGGPTAVMNASLVGFLEGAGNCEVLGVFGGASGLVSGDLRPLVRRGGANSSSVLLVPRSVAMRPGAFLGAGRRRVDADSLEAATETLTRAKVDGLCLIGGEGTMTLALQLDEHLRRAGAKVNVVGVPKTVDNDLDGTDHAPGYPSAARFVVQAIAGLAFDLMAMTSIEQVRVVETLGRRTGWLALAALAARKLTWGAPHLIFVPERPFSQKDFLDQVESVVARRGHALVVVAEGVRVGPYPSPFDQAIFDRPITGEAGTLLAGLVRDSLGCGARAEVLGVLQRCASFATSDVDFEEAHLLGVEAARCLRSGRGGVMVALATRRPGHKGPGPISSVPLATVAGHNRFVPEPWLPEPGGDADEFVSWLRPLLGRHPLAASGAAV